MKACASSRLGITAPLATWLYSAFNRCARLGVRLGTTPSDASRRVNCSTDSRVGMYPDCFAAFSTIAHARMNAPVACRLASASRNVRDHCGAGWDGNSAAGLGSILWANSSVAATASLKSKLNPGAFMCLIRPMSSPRSFLKRITVIRTTMGHDHAFARVTRACSQSTVGILAGSVGGYIPSSTLA